MKKSIKILVFIVSCVVVGLVSFFVCDKVINNQGTEKSNTVAENKVSNGNKNETSGNVEKINITNEDKLRILGYTPNFNSVEDLSTRDMVHTALVGIYRDWVPRIEVDEDGYVQDLESPYPESYIKNIVYSVFGVEINDYKTDEEDYITYKDGYFYCQWGDGDPIPEPINIVNDNKDGNTYYTYDVMYEGNIGIYYKGEKYEVCIDKDGFVRSKKSIADKLFENNESMKYNKSDVENPSNAFSVILNLGEKTFVTEQKNDYYIFKDDLGKTYEIKSIDEIVVTEELISEDEKYILYECNLLYTDKDGTEVDSDGNVRTISVGVTWDKEFKNCEIHSPIDNYIKTQKDERNYKSKNYY